MSATSYVMHDGHRWRVLRTITDPVDGELHELLRLVGKLGAARTSRTLWAKVCECTPWEKSGVRRIRTSARLRGRRVVFEFDPRTEVVTLRLERQRRAVTSTLGGIFDTLLRQRAAVERRDRAFARRRGGRGR